MRKGIVIRAFSYSSDFLGGAGFATSIDNYKRIFQKAASLGFQGVQLYAEIDDGFLSLETDERTLQAIGRAAREAGVGMPSLEVAPLQYSLTSDDPVERGKGVEVLRKALRAASHLGGSAVLVIPGYVGLPWVKGGGKPVGYEEAYQRTLEGLSELAPEAERLRIALLLENIWNMFLLSPLEMRGLIDQVNSEWVGVLFDTGNVVQFGFPEQWIRILGPRIKEVHLKDFRRAVGTVEGFVPLLAGDVNWPEVMRVLREVGFDGFLIAEAFPYETHGDVHLIHLAATLRRLIEEN